MPETTEKTNLAKAEPAAVAAKLPPLPILDNTTVLVKSPEDVEKAQTELLAWVSQQVAQLEAERDIAQENYDKAVKMKVATTGWKRQVTVWNKRVIYYSKIKAAIEQGYFIMPDLPFVIDLFAVRTDQKTVSGFSNSTYHDSADHGLKDVRSKMLPGGEGRFVSPQPETKTWSEKEKYTLHKGGEELTRQRYFAAASDISEFIDFPVKAVRPQVLDAVGKALAGKIFDELGLITPGRGSTQRGDPIVVGRIVNRDGTMERGCSFIVHWWVDTRDL